MSAQHFSRNILTESVWITLNEDTRNYLREWDEVAQLIKENIDLFEAELTAQQIDALFKGAEEYAISSGEFQTGLGKAGNAAASAGAAVAGTVKVGADVVRQVNNKINQLGKMIQDTTPVKNIDAAFDKAKKDMYDKLGGQDSKVNQIVTKLSDAAKAHPGAAKFAVGLLTAAASIAAGPAGGAAAGFLLRMGNDLLAGEKLSTAVGKSMKTAVAGFLAGKAFDWMSTEVKDWFSTTEMNDVANTVQQMKDADVTAAVADAKAQFGDAAEILQGSSVADASIMDISNIQNIQGQIVGANMRDVLLTPDQYNQYQALLSAADNIKPIVDGAANPEYISQVGKAFEYVKDLTQSADYAQNYEVFLKGQEAMSAISQAGKEALSNPGLQDTIAKLTGDAASDIAVMNQIADVAAGVGQGAVTAATMDNNKKESIDYELLYTKRLAGLPLTESEQKIVNEIGWADIKKGAAKAAGAVGAAAGKAGAAVAKGAKAVGKELGQQITARKLNQMWSKAGKPTDAASVFGVLQAAGMDNKALQAVSQQTNIKFEKPAPASKPGQGTQTSGDGGSAEVDGAPGAQVPSPGAAPKPNQAPAPAQTPEPATPVAEPATPVAEPAPAPAQTPEPAQPAPGKPTAPAPAQTPEPAQPGQQSEPARPGMASRIGRAIGGMAAKGARAAKAAKQAASDLGQGVKQGFDAGSPAAPAPGKPAAPAPAQPSAPKSLGQQNVDAANKAQADIDAEKPAAKKPGFDKATFQARADRGRARKAKIVRNDIHSDDETDESEDK